MSCMSAKWASSARHRLGARRYASGRRVVAAPRAGAACGCRPRRPRPGRWPGTRRRAGVAGGRVAGEGDAGGRVVAEVAEDHRLHVDRGAEVVAGCRARAGSDGARVVPRAGRRPRSPAAAARAGRREGRRRSPRAPAGGSSATSARRASASSSVSSARRASALAARARGRRGRPARRGRPRRTSASGGGRSPRRSARCPSAREPVDGRVVEAEVEDRVHHPRHGERARRSGPRPAAGARGSPKRATGALLERVRGGSDLLPAAPRATSRRRGSRRRPRW